VENNSHTIKERKRVSGMRKEMLAMLQRGKQKTFIFEGRITMKRKIAMLTVLVLTFGMLSGCGPKSENDAANTEQETKQETEQETEQNAEQESSTENKDSEFLYKIGVSNIQDADENPFLACDTFKKILDSDEFKERIGGHSVEVIWMDSQLDINKQTNNVETMLSQGIDAIFILGVDTAGNTTAVEACNKAGVPVFMTATESEGGEWKFVGFKEYDCGYHQGKYLAENAEENTNVCYLYGTPGREAFIQREQGFLDAIKESGREDIKVLSTQACPNTSAEEAMRVTEDWIQAYGDDINWIVTQANMLGQGAVETLKAAGKADQIHVNSWIHVGTWDADMVKEGYVDYAIYAGFDTLGKTMAEVCAKYYNGENIEERTYMELYDVTEENVNDFFK